jgi:hypothetical protein
VKDKAKATRAPKPEKIFNHETHERHEIKGESTPRISLISRMDTDQHEWGCETLNPILHLRPSAGNLPC